MDRKVKRNQEIYQDRIINKITWRKLIQKYGLSLTRLQFIIKRESIRKLK